MPMLGRYIVGEQLGEGGMGIVYAGVGLGGERVAIKVLRRERSRDPRAIRRFHDEAVAGRIVSHPHLVSVLEESEANGITYLVMSPVPGEPLGISIRRDGVPSLAVTISLVSQILDAVIAIHAAGIVHGDVKSDNILVASGEDGCPSATLIDLGLAHVDLGLGDPLLVDPTVEVVSGTPDYMAPEIARGCAPSTHSDVYAVGVILYELLTGTTPFAGGTSSEIMRRHLHDMVVPPSLRCPEREIPAILERITMHALEKQPSRRVASARTFLSALSIAARGCTDDRPGLRLPAFSTVSTTLDGRISVAI